MQAYKWYAVKTKPRWEKKIASALTDKKIENYCPLNRVERQWHDRKKIILEPLFHSYVFVRIRENETVPVLQVNGIISFVKWLGKPAVIRDEEIDIVKRFLNEYQNVRLEKCDIKVNDQVRIINGLFLFQQGKVIEVKTNTIKMLLPSLGVNIVAELDKTSVEKIEKPIK